MKMTRLISVFATGLMICLAFASCDKEKEQPEPEQASSDVVKAFLPVSYADKTVDAWYSVFSEEDYKTKVQAVFLFTDSTVIITKSKIYSQEDGRKPSRVIMYEGTFQIKEGNYKNGIASFKLDYGVTYNVEIVDGQLTVMNTTYTLQDKADIPAATESTQDEFIGDVQAYFPALNIETTVLAWYTDTTKESRRIKIEAVYLCTDSMVLFTKSQFYTQKDGRKPSYDVTDIGNYKLEGNYTNGTLNLTLNANVHLEAEINNGQLSIEEKVYIKQDNANLPEPMKQ